jgi:hypothetical protein
MTAGPIDFATVQWARRRGTELEPLLALPHDELHKLAVFLEKLACLKAADVTPTSAQMTVLLQYLHAKNLDVLEATKGGLQVQFSGGGYEYECFLLRDDGRIPNHKYESKRAT